MDSEKILKDSASSVSRFLDGLPTEKRKWLEKKQREANEEEYKKFRSALDKGICYICSSKLDTFIVEKPCLHWLLRPEGFNKKHFPLVYRKFSYFRIQPFLRWLANTEVLAVNINDLAEETNPKKLFEYTIKYKGLEWSFSCSKGDPAGHFSIYKDVRSPHYHFQMRIDRKPFIDYGDFHIPFKTEDFFHLPIALGRVPNARYVHGRGMGMQDAMTFMDPEQIVDGARRAEDDSSAMYHMSTLVEAEPGKGISGDEISEILKKHKQTGEPLAKLVKGLKNVRSIRTFIEPGPKVPEQAGRKESKSTSKGNASQAPL